MKTTTLPALRVTPDLREDAESVLEEGETLSGFVLEAVTRTIELRKARREFVTRGIASGARARKTGKHISAERVLTRLERRLVKAKKRRA